MPSPINMADFEEVPPAPAGGPVNLSDYEDVSEPAPAAPRKDALGNELKHGAGQTYVRDALDALTLGHHDEISGWIDAALQGHPLDGETYRRERDKYRAEMKQGDEEHPVAHYLGAATGAVASSFIPGLNVAKGAGLGATALKLGAIGGVAGLGASEADLTKGEFHKAALDTAFGAGVGAVTGMAGKKLADWIGNAPGRADKRLLSDIGQRANKSVRDKMAEDAADVLKTARKLGLNKVAQDAPELLEQAGKAKAELGAKLGQVYETVDREAGPVRVAKVVDKLAELEKRYTSNGQLSRAKAVQNVADEVITAFGDTAPTANFHQYVSALGDKAYETLSEKASAKVNRQIASAVNGALKEHVQDAAKAVPSLAPLARALPGINAEYGALAEITTAARQRARLSPYKPTGLRSFSLRGLAEAAADKTIGQVTRPMDERLSSLARAAAAGDQRAAQLLQIFQRAPTRGAVSAGAGAGVAMRPAFVDNPEDSDEAMASQ